MNKLSSYYFYFFVVVIDAGSRYEVDYPAGLSHVIEKLSFQVMYIIHDRYLLHV